MGRRIELPQLPKGEAQEQLQALYGYLYRMAEALNNNLAEIGNGDFTDEEMTVVREITGKSGTTAEGIPAEAETLKSLIIKTAQLIKSEIDEYNLKLIGTYEADGKLGRYVRKTRLDVDVTPTGIQQNYTFQDIIQGLKTYEVNAKNYIKTGLLRMESSIPVYGVAIGKDVVTFSSDGTETYNDGNKVAELTADELSFWQSGNKVASYTGSRISFYYGNTEAMYLQNGKLYCNDDFTIASGKIVKINNFQFTQNGMRYDDTNGNVMEYGDYDNAGADALCGVYSYSHNETALTVPAEGSLFFKTGVKYYGDADWTVRWVKLKHEKLGYPGTSGVCLYSDSTFFIGTPNNYIETLYAKKVAAAGGELVLRCYESSNWHEGLKLTRDSNRIYLLTDINDGLKAWIGSDTSTFEKAYLDTVYSDYLYAGNAYLSEKETKLKLANGETMKIGENDTLTSGTTGIMIKTTGTTSVSIPAVMSMIFQIATKGLNDDSWTQRQVELGFKSAGRAGTRMICLDSGSNLAIGSGDNELSVVCTSQIFTNSKELELLCSLESSAAYGFIVKRVDSGTDAGVYLLRKNGMASHYIGSSSQPMQAMTAYNYFNPSSREVKHDIRELESCGDRLDQLKPVTFIYNDDKAGRRRPGLIYEETVETVPEICQEDDGGKAINYTELVPMLLKEIQELRARVKALEEKG